MRFTLSWLKEHLRTDASLELISEKLTSLGLVVDKIHNKAEELAPFKICEIIEADKHPNADRLQVCRVNTGDEILQVVCGAANARKGLKVVLARPGDRIPSNNQILKVGKVRDVDSFGMLCSAQELLLEENSEGIIEVDQEAPLGESYAAWLGLNDPLIEIEITPNRGDCLGVNGIARDLSATGIGAYVPLKAETCKGLSPSPISLKLDREACPHFTGRVIRGVKNGPSPEWLQRKLRSIGLRPISALVDITNFFTYDRGRPLHVFDLDKLKGNLTVRLSHRGESFKALDGKSYALAEDMAVIADDSGVVSLGGIMGGESTGCEETTQNVFLECAFFDSIRTALTGRTLGILSDARYRFERGVDPTSTLPGLEAATHMILEICGGEASDIVEEGSIPYELSSITFSSSRVETLGGMKVNAERVHEILKSLGFDLHNKQDHIIVCPPSWRFDIEHEADLVEEILRVEGYDKIPSVSYGERPQQKPLAPFQERRFEVRDRLAARGLVEVITWSFVSQEEARLFGDVPDNLTLLNPISQDLSTMRPNVLPHLLSAARYNQNRALEPIGLFEIGPQFSDPTPQGQHMMAVGLRVGSLHSGHWSEKKRSVDIYDVKADALSILEMGRLTPQWDRTAPNWYHPGRSAALKLGQHVLGYFGEIHPHVIKAFDLKGPVVGFELFLDRLPLSKKKSTAKPKLDLSPYQSVERDFAFVVDQKVAADSLLKAATKADPSLIDQINLFDVFEMGDGKKSLAIRVRLQPKDHTLTEDEIQAVSQKIISLVAQNTGGVLRQ
ncbi:MAG: phenylalanine--tRNA ligase subunit beta [Proteobacteria bacterium]|nr:phenylalanine--tRNA ligase subunit beta [Pseudomonadota bacterium]